jgi:hypothetical protein
MIAALQARKGQTGTAMSIGHFFRVLFAVVLSGVIGWISLVALHAVKLVKEVERFQVTASDETFILDASFENAILALQGGGAVVLAAAIAGVLLGEVLRSRSLLFYAGATGALSVALAGAFWRVDLTSLTSPVSAALVMAGCVAGTIYWLIAGYSGPAR